MLAKEVKRIIRRVFEKECPEHEFDRTKVGGLGGRIDSKCRSPN